MTKNNKVVRVELVPPENFTAYEIQETAGSLESWFRKFVAPRCEKEDPPHSHKGAERF